MIRLFTICGRRYEFDSERIEAALAAVLPDPVREHYVVIGSRRFPPKQVVCAVTGLDRADFTTHQARRILTRIGFAAARLLPARDHDLESAGSNGLPHGGLQAEALRAYTGQWVALGGPCEVLVAADSLPEVIGWLARHDRVATGGILRVPGSAVEAQGAAPA